MHTLFGITLVLYLLKLSAGKGFWKNLRNVGINFETLVAFSGLDA